MRNSRGAFTPARAEDTQTLHANFVQPVRRTCAAAYPVV